MKLEMPQPFQSQRRFSIARAPFSPDVRHALERIFENVFCSAVRVDDTAWAYVAAIDGDIRLVILFSKQGGVVTVLNELFDLASEDLQRFAEDLFGHYPDLRVIALPSVAVGEGALSFPLQRFNATEDIVASLPGSVDRYWAMLSKNTRESIRRYRKRLVQQFPDMRFDFYECDAAGLERLLAIVDLNRARITSKSERPSHTEQSLAQLVRMVGRYGLTLVASSGGKICGGVICTSIGGHFYMHVIAHDPAFDALRLGKLCCYLSICSAIERGGREYHMLSGQYDYKFRFMGQQRDYDRVTLYRSRWAMLRHWPRYGMNWIRGEGRALKKIMKDWRRQWIKLHASGPA